MPGCLNSGVPQQGQSGGGGRYELDFFQTERTPEYFAAEAARQAIQAVCAPYRVLPTELRTAFHTPLTLTPSCHISATRLPTQDAGEDAVVRVTAWQSGRLAFDCAAQLAAELLVHHVVAEIGDVADHACDA